MCRKYIQFHMRFNLTDFSPYCSRCKSISSLSSSLYKSNTEAVHQKCVFCFQNRTAVDSCCSSKKRKKRFHYDSIRKIISRLLIMCASVALISLLPTANCLRQREDSLANIDTRDGGPIASYNSEHGISGHQNQYSPSEKFHNKEIDEPDEPIEYDYDFNKTPEVQREYEQLNGKSQKATEDDYEMVEIDNAPQNYREQKLESSKNNNYNANNNNMPPELNQFHRRLSEKSQKSAKTNNKNDEIEADNQMSHAKSTEKTNVEESSVGTCAKSVAGGCKSREDMEVESIKQHLLLKLGMQSEPSGKKFPKLSDAVTRKFCERFKISEDACFGRKSDYQSDEYDSSASDLNEYFDTDDINEDEKYQFSAIQQRISTFPSCEYFAFHFHNGKHLIPRKLKITNFHSNLPPPFSPRTLLSPYLYITFI